MNHRIRHRLILIQLLIAKMVILCVPVFAQNPSRTFLREVLPILEEKCIRCHGAERQESMIRLDTLSTNLMSDRSVAEDWHEVLQVIDAAEMPPEDEPPLSEEQYERLSGWVRQTLERYVEATAKQNGRVVHRRLNRVEYQNTMSDLLGLEMNYSMDLPPDSPSVDGFKNNGLALQMSALQMEYFIATARQALDRVIIAGPAPNQFEHEFKESNVKNWLGRVQRSNRLQRSQVFLGTMTKDYPEEGEFRIQVTFSSELRPNKGYPILEVSVGYRPDTEVLFRSVGTAEITSEQEQTLEFTGRLENYPLPVRGQGKYPGLVVRVRNLYDDGSPRPKGDKGVFPDEPELPVIHIQSLNFEAPVFEQWPPRLHRALMGTASDSELDERVRMSNVLSRFLPRAFRRPVTESEIKKFLDFFDSIREEFPTFEEAARETLTLALISPDFLYLVEPAGEEKRPVTSWELASRLSYFLWSTMPDEELSSKAADDSLIKKEVLAQQILRMISDERSIAFVDQFTRQWLNLDVVDRVSISKDYHPGFSNTLKQDMVGETQQFFARLLRENMSAIQLLDSDFTMMNEALAKHYGYEGVWGREFRPIQLKSDDQRGGLLGQASILLSNSTGSDSHAVRRAVWIRDRLLNDPPKPPPPDVPTLEEADPKFLDLTIREQLEVHRERVACSSCHKDIDPWGIALENFDAVGLWRSEVRRKKGKKFETLPVNSVDQLPDGSQLQGAEGLRRYLVQNQTEPFARSLVSRLLAYALGRQIDLSDQRMIDELTLNFRNNGLKLKDLIVQIAQSEAFHTK